MNLVVIFSTFAFFYKKAHISFVELNFYDVLFFFKYSLIV